MKKWNLKNILVLFKEEASQSHHEKRHQSSLAQVCEVLQKHRLSYKVLRRERLCSTIRESLVITVGGDGTFLHASHFANASHLLLGINSVPEASHGAFCISHAEGFEKVVLKLLAHQAPITPLSRLEAKKNGKSLPFLALNDILFANVSPAGTSRYWIQAGKKREEQKSSGVWIATPSGSTAAIRSAGGKILPKHSRQFQFLVREPFQQGKTKLKLLKDVLRAQEKLILNPQMSRAGLFIDGAHIHHDLKLGDKIEIKLSKSLIWAVMR